MKPGAQKSRLPRPKPRSRGFILIVIAGMLVVLIVLGISFAEQGRVDLLGARNSRDLSAVDGLSECGFEFALGALRADRNVESAVNGGWNSQRGTGITSRWDYNGYVSTATASGGVAGPVPAPNRADPRNFLDSWAPLFWNEEDKGTNFAFGYAFKFDPADVTSRVTQRHPPDPRSLMDAWLLQPLARVRKFRVRSGTSFGTVQVAITPRDGGINVNDCYDQGTVNENVGWYETLPIPPGEYGTGRAKSGNITVQGDTYPYNVDWASPDRRTMEYVLGRRPEFVNRSLEIPALFPAKVDETASYNGGNFLDPSEDWNGNGVLDTGRVAQPAQPEANTIHGNKCRDDGVYCFPRWFEPGGIDPILNATSSAGGIYDYGYAAWLGSGFLTKAPKGGTTYPSNPTLNCPTTFYNADPGQPFRYNYEGARYVLWSTASGMSLRFDQGSKELLYAYWSGGGSGKYRWYPSGRFRLDPRIPMAVGINGDTNDKLFWGFGFDRLNPKRAGAGTAAVVDPYIFTTDEKGKKNYIGAGAYGHVRARSFQNHLVSAAGKGKFWTDLMAAWYFGGAPGYTAELGAATDSSNVSNWTRLGSSYDSIGMGTHWMGPTAHVWSPGWSAAGAWSCTGALTSDDIVRGLNRPPGNMLPVKPAATYASPYNKWDDDHRNASTQFTYLDTRTGIRASGIQENYGLFGADSANGRFYDAININVTNFNVMYGLLTPEKIPSMLNRTTVAAHLHWKARLLEGAYKEMDKFKRYDPNVKPPTPYPFRDAFVVAPAPGALEPNGFGKINGGVNVDPYNPDLDSNGIGDFDLAGASPVADRIDPLPSPYSLHRAYLNPSNLNPLDGAALAFDPARVSLGKMDFTTKEPTDYMGYTVVGPPVVPGATIRKGSGQIADDVFINCHYNTGLYETPLNTATSDALSGNTQVARPDNEVLMPLPAGSENWSDWFLHRNATIPAVKDGVLPNPTKFKPQTNTYGWYDPDPYTQFPEGVVPALGGAGIREYSAAPGALPVSVVPHPEHGLPNPDYLQMTPGAFISIYWADQFRRYFPVKRAGTQFPSQSATDSKMVDADNNPLTDMIHPENPVPKAIMASDPDATKAWVPAVNKDEAWRITRIGRKYQEIVADEFMDYQINPWWPNPCVHFTETAVPLDKAAYISEARQAALADGNLKDFWPSAYAAKTAGAAGLDYQIPDYYAYWNRFWCRPNTKYKRNGNAATRERGEPYRAADDLVNPLLAKNPVENRGIYPQAYQYFGYPVVPGPGAAFSDRIIDFPQNTLEDAQGGEWRYVAAAIPFMLEQASSTGIRQAPARNHPFKNWADVAGMLGHLVYRPPWDDAKRDHFLGVDATAVCPGTFFDGSRIVDADALAQGIVARQNYWPISGNYGAYYDDTQAPPYVVYPNRVAPWTADPEWQRRIDEWRGRDAAGLRIEHHYISEAAANDVLVSLSNGRVAPIDFDGDGHVTMTSRDNFAYADSAAATNDADKFSYGYPWHDQASLPAGWPTVEVQQRPGKDYNSGKTTLEYGLRNNVGWAAVAPNKIIQGCVTLPLKFRSNTFRVTVVAELTDPQYKTVYSTRRFSRVYSRIPGAPAAGKVNGPYTGEFVLHSDRAIYGTDPEASWLGSQ